MAWIMYVSITVNVMFLLGTFLINLRKRLKTFAYAKVLKSNQGKILIKKIDERGQNRVLNELELRQINTGDHG